MQQRKLQERLLPETRAGPVWKVALRTSSGPSRRQNQIRRAQRWFFWGFKGVEQRSLGRFAGSAVWVESALIRLHQLENPPRPSTKKPPVTLTLIPRTVPARVHTCPTGSPLHCRSVFVPLCLPQSRRLLRPPPPSSPRRLLSCKSGHFLKEAVLFT